MTGVSLSGIFSLVNGRQVRSLREDLGMTQAEFAALLKVEQPTVSDWERERRRVVPFMSEYIRLKVQEHRSGLVAQPA